MVLQLTHPDSALLTGDAVGIDFFDLDKNEFASIKLFSVGLDILARSKDIRIRAGGVSNQPMVNMEVSAFYEAVRISKNGISPANPPSANTTLDVDGQLETDSIIIKHGAQNGYVLTSTTTGKATWQPLNDDPTLIEDADGDTRIHVEQFADEDVIRFGVSDLEMATLDVNGLELSGALELFQNETRHFLFYGPHISVENSGNSTFLGKDAGAVDDLTNNENTYVGYKAGETTTGLHNTHVGAYAGQIATNHDHNTLIGFGAGQAVASSENVLIGVSAGGGNANGTGKNVMIGFQTGQNSSGKENVYIGHENGKSASGDANTFIGYRAGFANSTGGQNTYLGRKAGEANTGGSGNVMIGESAGFLNANGTGHNTFLGYLTGSLNDGANNTYLGYRAGEQSTGSNNVFIGKEAGQTETRSNLLIIENNDGSVPLITGDFTADSVNIGGVMKVGNAIGSQLYVGNTLVQSGGTNSLRIDAAVRPFTDNVNQLGGSSKRWTTVYAVNGTINTSDMRAKKNVKEMEYGLQEILNLRPVSFHWNEESLKEEKHLGLIAQELNEVIPEVVEVPSSDDDLYGVKYADLIPVLIKSIQEQHLLIEKQQEQINELLKKTNK
jgi:hypothetical protein